MLNALRLVDGFPLALFTQRTGLPSRGRRRARRAEKAGLVERDHAHVRPTAKGQRFLNDLIKPFLPAREMRARTIPISISSPGTSRPS
jgi:oxygen-independent coproporphyrinogen-3 oxidase